VGGMWIKQKEALRLKQASLIFGSVNSGFLLMSNTGLKVTFNLPM
jgi:hypothetical protein